MCRKFFMLLVAFIFCSCLCVSCFASTVTAKVNSSSAKVYQTASTSSRSVSIKKGTSLKVTAVKGDWARVSSGGHTGYMKTKYLSRNSGGSTSSKKYMAYVAKDSYVYKSASSSSAKRSVSKGTKIYVTGTSGDYYKVRNSGGTTGYMKKSCVSQSKPSSGFSSGSSSGSWKSKVVKMDWFGGGSNVLKKGSYGYIYDIDKGIALKIKRMGGHNHADVEPATYTDTQKLLKISNGKFSWKSHAVILSAGGKYVACGINCMPHGDQTIKTNGYDGQFCLHMVNSRTHGSDSVNTEHQKSIDRAYRWAHK